MNEFPILSCSMIGKADILDTCLHKKIGRILSTNKNVIY